MKETDAEPFDMTTLSDTSIDASSDALKPGGQGLQLVRRIVDEIKYDYTNRTSTITMVMYLENRNANH